MSVQVWPWPRKHPHVGKDAPLSGDTPLSGVERDYVHDASSTASWPLGLHPPPGGDTPSVEAGGACLASRALLSGSSASSSFGGLSGLFTYFPHKAVAELKLRRISTELKEGELEQFELGTSKFQPRRQRNFYSSTVVEARTLDIRGRGRGAPASATPEL